jgi:membrane protease YdiL (CAAX protease family)
VALAEEALFRYALLGGLARWTQSPLLGLGVSTLVFGLAHLPGHLRVARRGWAPVRRVLDLTLFGLVLGVLVLATDSFWPALIVHGGRNYILRCLLVSKREYARYHADKLADKLADGLADELAESAPGERDGKLRDGARRS